MPVDDPTSTPNRFLLFIGGDEHPDASAGGWRADVVVAVDSGLHVASALGIRVDHVVGDMDSVDPAALAAAEAAGAEMHVHPPDKDATDLELALDLVLALRGRPGGGLSAPSPEEPWAALHVVGGGGGRLDHLVGDLLMLSGPRLAEWDVTARLGASVVSVVRPGRLTRLSGAAGDQVSLLPFHGDATGVTTAGLRWPLVDGHLAAGTSRAISNELAEPSASVSMEQGSLVVVQPGTRGAVAETRPGPYDPTPRPPVEPHQETSP